MVSASTMAEVVSSTLPETAALISALALILSWRVPVPVGVTSTVNTPGEVSVMVPLVMVVPPMQPAKDVKEFIAWAKANPGKPVEVHAFQRVENGLTMIAESGPARIIEVDHDGKVQREVKLQVDHPNAHSDTRRVRKIANAITW